MDRHELPAILGGEPAVDQERNPIRAYPSFDADTERCVLEVLRSGNLSGHECVSELEKAYSEYTRAEYALAHCNGTAALFAAFHALGLGPGDEVIVPGATFWASVVPLLWLGVIPVFAETEPEQLGLDPFDVESKITDRTKAIVVVHLFGIPSKMRELREIAFKHKLKIIEDASHAHGAVFKYTKCGNLGDVAVFSLQTNKLAPAGEGGILLTNDRMILEKAIALGDMSRLLHIDSPLRRYAATTFGQKTRIASLSAAVGLSQIRTLDQRNKIRNDNCQFIASSIQDLGFDVFGDLSDTRRVYFEFVIRRVEGNPLTSEQWIESLQAEGCEISLPRYPLLHQQPLFIEKTYAKFPAFQHISGYKLPDYRSDALPQTERLNSDLIRLSVFTDAESALPEAYVHAFRKISTHSAVIAKTLSTAHSASA